MTITKSPVFAVLEPQHFSDYGFDPHFDYFQILEDARKPKKELAARSIESLHFKLQKPICKDESHSRKKRRWCWKKALFFFKSKWATHQHHNPTHFTAGCRSISGPIYATESLTGSNTPYFSLRDVNMEMDQHHHEKMPIYLVT